jgi:hypothetical protein
MQKKHDGAGAQNRRWDMSGNILIVDDEPHILRLLASKLKVNRFMFTTT